MKGMRGVYEHTELQETINNHPGRPNMATTGSVLNVDLARRENQQMEVFISRQGGSVM